VLSLAPGELDLEAFERLAAEGRAALAEGDVATACSLRPVSDMRRVTGSRVTSANIARSGWLGSGSTSRNAQTTRRWSELSSRARN
jgi:hypothetical protein